MLREVGSMQAKTVADLREKMKREKMYTLLHMLLLMAVLQIGRVAVRYVLFLLLRQDEITENIVSSVLMLILAAAVILISKRQKTAITVFPKKWGIGYIAATVISAGLIISSALMQEFALTSTAGILYGSVCTPIAEELLFRGYVWNRLKERFNHDISVAVITAVLFALWHLGYADVIAGKVQFEKLAFIMMMKVFVGLCYGAVLGVVRMKVKNCYATMLLHGVMNVFGR